MGVASSATGGLVAGISSVVMALAAVGAGYAYALWQEFPTATDVVGTATLATLRPLVPFLFVFFLGLFVLSAGATLYSIRGLRGF